MYDMAKTIRDAKRRRKAALRWRNKGLTIQAVADKFGVSKARMREILIQAAREVAK
jgi:DNA-directed RNA polymerase sigma subunit (sigma70/sigma32)